MKIPYLTRLLEIKEIQLANELNQTLYLMKILKELKSLNYLTDMKGGKKNGNTKRKNCNE